MSRRAAPLAVIALMVGLLTGCASTDPFAHAPIAQHLTRDDGVGECARLLRQLDREVVAAGARDAQDTVVPGFPYLRVDRLHASLGASLRVSPRASPRASAEDPARFARWRARLLQLDRAARAHELRNAGVAAGPVHAALGIDACRQILLDADDAPAAQAALRAAAQVPDDYSTLLRAAGLYPLTRLPFAAGIRGWHAQTRATFSQPLDALPVTGRLVSYALEADAARALDAPWVGDRGRARAPEAAVTPITRDALGLPQVESLAALLARHAPLLQVDESGAFDRIGPLAFTAASGAEPRITVDLDAAPVAYVRLTHGRLGRVLRPQLVYTFWFPARPKDGPLDLLGGELDALIWRVTLDDDGHALAYDSIHACGCYHLFFATERVQARPDEPALRGALDEGLFMPQPPLTVPRADERVVLRVASRSHYLQRVLLQPAAALPPAALGYRLRDEDELRSLPLPGASGPRRRSAYDDSGMIPGSERLERFFFWPMGIASAGQMRQWGRHATAFVGRRHFDDPDLLDRYFVIAAPSTAPVASAAGPRSPNLIPE